jgi:hypothetical protein
MVLTPAECSEISRQNEIYRMASRMLGYDMCCVAYMISIMHSLIINVGFVINRVTRHQ